MYTLKVLCAYVCVCVHVHTSRMFSPAQCVVLERNYATKGDTCLQKALVKRCVLSACSSVLLLTHTHTYSISQLDQSHGGYRWRRYPRATVTTVQKHNSIYPSCPLASTRGERTLDRRGRGEREQDSDHQRSVVTWLGNINCYIGYHGTHRSFTTAATHLWLVTPS